MCSILITCIRENEFPGPGQERETGGKKGGGGRKRGRVGPEGDAFHVFLLISHFWETAG